jgi:hypothetical protein
MLAHTHPHHPRGRLRASRQRTGPVILKARAHARPRDVHTRVRPPHTHACGATHKEALHADGMCTHACAGPAGPRPPVRSLIHKRASRQRPGRARRGPSSGRVGAPRKPEIARADLCAKAPRFGRCAEPCAGNRPTRGPSSGRAWERQKKKAKKKAGDRPAVSLDEQTAWPHRKGAVAPRSVTRAVALRRGAAPWRRAVSPAPWRRTVAPRRGAAPCHPRSVTRAVAPRRGARTVAPRRVTRAVSLAPWRPRRGAASARCHPVAPPQGDAAASNRRAFAVAGRGAAFEMCPTVIPTNRRSLFD